MVQTIVKNVLMELFKQRRILKQLTSLSVTDWQEESVVMTSWVALKIFPSSMQ